MWLVGGVGCQGVIVLCGGRSSSRTCTVDRENVPWVRDIKSVCEEETRTWMMEVDT